MVEAANVGTQVALSMVDASTEPTEILEEDRGEGSLEAAMRREAQGNLGERKRKGGEKEGGQGQNIGE